MIHTQTIITTLSSEELQKLIKDAVSTSIASQKQPSAELQIEKLLNVKEVSEILGVSRPTIDKLIKAGKLASTYISGRKMFTKRDIEQFIESRNVRGVQC